MPRYRFHTLDVFTDTPFGGNPLAVVLDADDLSGESMQIIAAEFNLSETVFVLKPAKAGANYRRPVSSESVPLRPLPAATK